MTTTRPRRPGRPSSRTKKCARSAALTATGPSGVPDRLHPAQGREPDSPRYVEYIEDPAGDQHDAGLGSCQPPPRDKLGIRARLQLPGRGDRMRRRRRAADPVTGAGPASVCRTLGAAGNEGARAHWPAHRRVPDGGVGHPARCPPAPAPQHGIDQLATLPPGYAGIDSAAAAIHSSPGQSGQQIGVGLGCTCNVCRATATTCTLAEQAGRLTGATPHSRRVAGAPGVAFGGSGGAAAAG